tara:strand:+ start:2916 stop:3152 length:237 start_codon:yes stop_codon:yes gene_type:complete
MESNSNNTYDVLERIANALERQNALLENQQSRQIKLDMLEAKVNRIKINESRVVKSTQTSTKKLSKSKAAKSKKKEDV